MKILFDENLSPALVVHLAAESPGSAHVRGVGLRGAPDPQVWEHARALGFTIVSKNTDFRERSFVDGFPPKVIWLDVGHAGTAQIAALLQGERQRVERFEQSVDASLLILSIGASAV